MSATIRMVHNPSTITTIGQSVKRSYGVDAVFNRGTTAQPAGTYYTQIKTRRGCSPSRIAQMRLSGW